jgi:hypothetical protein
MLIKFRVETWKLGRLDSTDKVYSLLRSPSAYVPSNVIGAIGGNSPQVLYTFPNSDCFIKWKDGSS